MPQRRKTILLALLFYWPAMFVITHIPEISRWVAKAQISDKTAHFLAYLVLTFLWWFTISPDTKVKWNKPAVWWTLLVIIWYGAFDEYLQCFVGRNANVADFLANLVGTIAALLLLSIFTFWPASLVVTAIVIFGSTNLSRINLAALLPTTYIILHLFAYAFFALLWAGYLRHRLPPRLAPALAQPQVRATQDGAVGPSPPKSLLVTSAMPFTLLLGVKIFSFFLGKAFSPADIIAAAVGIATVTVTFHLAAVLRCKC